MASGFPVAQPVAGHDTEHDEENIPVAQAYVPGAQPSYQYAQATPVVAQPVGGHQQVYNATPAYNATPVTSYPQYETGKVPPTPPTPYAPTPYNNYDQSGKRVVAGTLAQQSSPKILGLPKKIFFLILGLILLVIVGVGVGVGVAVSGGGDDKSSGANSPPGQNPVNPSSPVTNTPPSPGSPGTTITNTPGSPPEIIPIFTVGGATAPSSPTTPSTNPTPPSTTPQPPSATLSSPATTPSPPARTTAPAPASSLTLGTLSADGQALVTAINQERQKNGVSALTVDSTLVCTAQRLSRSKGGLTNPTCNSEGFPLATRISQCSVTFDGQINQLTGCEYFTPSFQVDSWASDTNLSEVLLDPSFRYVGGDGYPNGKFWTAIFA